MTPDELIRTMQGILRDEREAIRRLDAAAVGRATTAKEKLLRELQASADQGERAAYADALLQLKPELQQNLILLTHARDCLRDVIESCRNTRRPRLDAKL